MAGITLLKHTLYLVRNRPRTVTYAIIAKKTRIPERWLQNLVAGKMKDPGVNKIETLYVFLAKKPLVKAAR